MPKMRPIRTEVVKVTPRMLKSIYGAKGVKIEIRKART